MSGLIRRMTKWMEHGIMTAQRGRSVVFDRAVDFSPRWGHGSTGSDRMLQDTCPVFCELRFSTDKENREWNSILTSA